MDHFNRLAWNLSWTLGFTWTDEAVSHEPEMNATAADLDTEILTQAFKIMLNERQLNAVANTEIATDICGVSLESDLFWLSYYTHIDWQ